MRNRVLLVGAGTLLAGLLGLLLVPMIPVIDGVPVQVAWRTERLRGIRRARQMTMVLDARIAAMQRRTAHPQSPWRTEIEIAFAKETRRRLAARGRTPPPLSLRARWWGLHAWPVWRRNHRWNGYAQQILWAVLLAEQGLIVLAGAGLLAWLVRRERRRRALAP